MNLPRINTKGYTVVEVVVGFVVIGIIITTVFLFTRPDEMVDETPQNNTSKSEPTSTPPAYKNNELALNWSRGECQDEGTVMFGALPMNIDDFSVYTPYGLMIDAHVTPIDHSYFEPADRSLGRDVYDVMAIADGHIVEIGKRTQDVSGEGQLAEYRIIFEHTCTFYSYFDLVTSLTPDIQAAFDEVANSSNYASSLRIPVTEGQVIGKIGGQTLDFGVYNADVMLDFISPELYQSEFWKIHTDDPFPYFKEPIRAQLLGRNVRQAEPRAGKIDYDQPGKLIGNWFKEGTNGYQGVMQNRYWDGHLSIAPDHIDPRLTIVSTGDYAGETKQFAVRNDGFDPSQIDVSSGIVTIELGQIDYTSEDTGEHINPYVLNVLGKTIKARAGQFVQGVLLVQVLDGEMLKVEAFPEHTLSNAPVDFTQEAIIYER